MRRGLAASGLLLVLLALTMPSLAAAAPSLPETAPDTQAQVAQVRAFAAYLKETATQPAAGATALIAAGAASAQHLAAPTSCLPACAPKPPVDPAQLFAQHANGIARRAADDESAASSRALGASTQGGAPDPASFCWPPWWGASDLGFEGRSAEAGTLRGVDDVLAMPVAVQAPALHATDVALAQFVALGSPCAPLAGL